VKPVLEETAVARRLRLPARLTESRPDCYARRLLHRDLERGYTAVVMTRGPGQGTPLHDHAGMWRVEGVIEGRIEVARYDPRATRRSKPAKR
jgi:predicted metal-dependent enzyme (double-stranded beta helix superfamily)